MLNLYNYHDNPQSLTGYKDRIKVIPELALNHAINNLPNRSPDLEPTILKNHASALFYAKDVIQGRWKEAEPIIINRPRTATFYSIWVLKHRWKEAEPFIKQDDDAWNTYNNYFKDK